MIYVSQKFNLKILTFASLNSILETSNLGVIDNGFFLCAAAAVKSADERKRL